MNTTYNLSMTDIRTDNEIVVRMKGLTDVRPDEPTYGHLNGLQSFWITSFYSSNLKNKQQQQQNLPAAHKGEKNQKQFVKKGEAKKCNQWFQSDKFSLEHNLQHNCNEHREAADQGYIQDYYPQLLHQQQIEKKSTHIYEKNDYDYRVFDLQPLTFSNRLQRDSNKLNFAESATKREDCSASTILETKFSATDTTMDDVLCQNHNQNSIYVLNSNYSTYVNFPQFNNADRMNDEKLNKDGKNYGITMTTAASAAKSTLSVPRIFHCKLKTLAENAGNPNVSSASSAICLPPAAAAIQKILNCTKMSATIANNNINNNNNNNSNHNNNKSFKESQNNNNNNNHFIEERDCCLSSIMSSDIPGIVDAPLFHDNLNNNINISNNNNNNNIIINHSKKKSTNVKAHLIAKKTKFLQYLEEEKLRNLSENDHGRNKHEHQQQQQQQQQQEEYQQQQQHHEIDNSGMMKSTLQQATTTTTPTTTRRRTSSVESCCSICETKANIETKSTCGNSMSPVKVFENNKKHNNLATIQVTTPTNEGYDKSNNSTGNSDKIFQKQQQQQQHQREQEQYIEILKNLNKSNSNYEFYSETADLFGLGCTLCDNCRCLDCQSGYFDCDDWESNSDLSLMDEYEEQFVFDPSMRFHMQPCNYYYDENDTTTTTNGCNERIYRGDQNNGNNWHANDCIQINCNDAAGAACFPNESNCECSAIEHVALAANGDCHNHDADADADADADGATIVTNDHRSNTSNSHTNGNSCSDLLRPLEKTIRNNELENCASFNELSLLDENTKGARKSKQQEVTVQ